MTEIRLIDANALIEALKSNCDLCADKNTNWCEHCCPHNDFEDLIDNAPTEPQVTVFAENASKEEIADFKQELENVLERPKGEWEESHILSCGNILRMGMNVIEQKCKNCGRWSIKWLTTIPDNFCSNCGAKMKDGGEEE